MDAKDRLKFSLANLEVDPDLKVCPRCLDTGVVVEEEDGVARARPCECRVSETQTRRLEGIGIPARYRSCTLKNFDPKQAAPEVKAAYDQAGIFADSYPNVERGLLFMGPVGVGKTHLATAVVNHLATAKGVSCRWCDFAELLTEIRRLYSAGSFDEYKLVEPLVKTEMLLIDDLGSMKIPRLDPGPPFLRHQPTVR